ncbi:MAG: MoxR family ATPase [Chloroflexi bacterium]|nr:MoxR family ATPase [Chloroflexota bacterium]
MTTSVNSEFSAEAFRQTAAAIEQQIGQVIVGQREVIRTVLIAIVAGGHTLLEGVPGLGKTMLIRTLGQALHLEFSRIQFTPDLMPADITGTEIMEEQDGRRAFHFQRGPIFANLILADEINRATPKTQSAMLEAMQEKTVTVGNETYTLPQPFFVLATQNPLEMEGTYPLPEAQLDRFLFKVDVLFPSAAELSEILLRTTGERQPTAAQAATGATLVQMQELARKIPVPTTVVDYISRLVVGTHPEATAAPLVRQYVRYGSSPRGAQALVLGAKITALLAGRYNASFEDVVAVARPALRHRLILNFEAQAENVSADAVVEDLLKHVTK